MHLDALDHLAHDAVIVLRFVGAVLGYDTLDFFQPRLPGAVLVDVLLNCGNAAVKLLDLIGDAFEFILAAFYVFYKNCIFLIFVDLINDFLIYICEYYMISCFA